MLINKSLIFKPLISNDILILDNRSSIIKELGDETNNSLKIDQIAVNQFSLLTSFPYLVRAAHKYYLPVGRIYVRIAHLVEFIY